VGRACRGGLGAGVVIIRDAEDRLTELGGECQGRNLYAATRQTGGGAGCK